MSLALILSLLEGMSAIYFNKVNLHCQGRMGDHERGSGLTDMPQYGFKMEKLCGFNREFLTHTIMPV